MNLTKVKLDETEAEEQYKIYRELVKTRKAKEYNDLRRAYHAMSKGYKVIDIYKAFEDTGVDEKGNPKLAISIASARSVGFHKLGGGSGYFSNKESRWGNSWDQNSKSVVLPAQTFPEWPTRDNSTWQVIDRELTTNVPIVPGNLLPKDSLDNYYILFEVDQWRPNAAVDDPYLLKRINDNTFIVYAEWDVSDVEKVVMRGRVG